MTPGYWNHNTAYHPWILGQVRGRGRVLDVGCGDGLLLARLAPFCRQVVGLEPDRDARERAAERLREFSGALVLQEDFLAFDAPAGSFDAVIFAASLHHMDGEAALLRARDLLTPGGILLIVGLTRSAGMRDLLADAVRVVPAKIGSLLHGERGDIGVPTAPPSLTEAEFRRLLGRILPGAAVRRSLYWRTLAAWEKPSEALSRP